VIALELPDEPELVEPDPVEPEFELVVPDERVVVAVAVPELLWARAGS
jgi:hypothetical protein